jgi:hypothetical protein
LVNGEFSAGALTLSGVNRISDRPSWYIIALLSGAETSMVVLRSFSLALIVFALMLVGADVISTLEMQGTLVVRSLAQILLLLGLDATATFQSYLPTRVSDFGVMVLNWPSWATLGVLGVIIAALSMRHAE